MIDRSSAMKCLNCGKEGVHLSDVSCSSCGELLAASWRDALPAGTLLDNGKYEIAYPIGKGGFGITYRAIHRAFNAAVAIKEFYPRDVAERDTIKGSISVPRSLQADFERGIARFLREGQTLLQIKHPNVVRVQDCFQDRGTAFLVMELIKGQTLRELLDQTPAKCLSEAQTVTIVEQLVGALDAVHRKSVFHLDLKPQNILIDQEGQAIIVDFGAAKRELSQTRSLSTIAFTPLYAPPELAIWELPEDLKRIGPWSDIFELGMMLHELLTGQIPPSSQTRMTAQLFGGHLIEVAAILDGHWQQKVEVALRLKPEDRPRSISEWWGKESSTPEIEERNQSGTTDEDKDLREVIFTPGTSLGKRNFRGRVLATIFITLAVILGASVVYVKYLSANSQASLQQRLHNENQQVIQQLRLRISKLRTLANGSANINDQLNVFSKRLDEATTMPPTEYQRIGQARSEVETGIVLLERVLSK